MSSKKKDCLDYDLDRLTKELKEVLQVKYSDPNGPTYQSLFTCLFVQ